MLIDSHCHLGFKELGENSEYTDKLLLNARQAGVEIILNIATEPSNFNNYLNFKSAHVKIYNAIGLHPLHIKNHEHFMAYDIEKFLTDKNIIALGETGFDCYYGSEQLEQQKKIFNIHAEVAIKNKLPLIIHTRNADSITLQYLSEYKKEGGVGGVIHCFTGDKDFLYKLLDLDFYISFSGIVTFKSATIIQQALKEVPLNRILIETDAPYLAPMPMRGKINLPEYVFYVSEYIANYLNISSTQLNKHIKDNFFKLFSLT